MEDKALRFYKFIIDNKIYVDWRGTNLNVWIDFSILEEFTKVVGDNYLNEEFPLVYLTNTGIVMEITDICSYLRIKPEDILKKTL